MNDQHGNPASGERRKTAARLWRIALLGVACTIPMHVAHRFLRASEGPRPVTSDSGETATPPAASVNQPVPVEPTQLLQQTVELMRTTQGRLASNQLDDETSRLQHQIEEHLAQLLKLTEQQAAQRPKIMPAEQPPESSAPNSPSGGGTGDQQRQSSQAGESSEQPRSDDELTQDEIQRRQKLATAVWGHLPPRLRDRMHGAFSERFLPQYDDLVRRYYEALATQGDTEP